MKNSITAFGLIMLLFVACNKNNDCPMEQKTGPKPLPKSASSTSVITSATGIAHAYSTRGSCIRGYGNCMVAVSGELEIGPKTPQVNLSVTANGQLQMVYETFVDTEGETSLEIDPDGEFSLPASICSTLGYSNITVQAGIYPLSYDISPFGSVLLNITVQQ